MERNWIVSHVKDNGTVLLICRSRGKEREELTLSCSSWHSGEFQLFPRILNRKKTTYEFYVVKKDKTQLKAPEKSQIPKPKNRGSFILGKVSTWIFS